MLEHPAVMAMPRPDALVLCGGRANRLGGIDKPLRRLAGQALVAHVLDRITPQAGRIILSANRNHAAYAALGHRVIDDGERVDCGPLAGIAAGLAQAESDCLACVPGDAPRLPTDLIARLAAALDAGSADIAFVDDGDGPQPLCSLIRCSLLADLRRYLDVDGGRTPREWFRRHACVAVDFSAQPRWIWSVNTDEEWRAAEQRLAALTLE